MKCEGVVLALVLHKAQQSMRSQLRMWHVQLQVSMVET